MPTKRTDVSKFIGKTFNWLTVTEEAEFCRHSMVKVLCVCGKTLVLPLSYIRNGNNKSCGCKIKEAQAESGRKISTKHGYSKYPEYPIWTAMINRCSNPTNKDYKNYGGRGIKVSDEWRKSFETFICDMGRRPDKTLTLERVNNELGYSKENCMWASRHDQRMNQRPMYEAKE